MTIFIAADHHGFELKNQLMEYIQEQNIRVEDLGSYQVNPQDDYPEYGHKVAQAIQQNPQEFLGIVICGSGVGVAIAANRFPTVRCGLGFDEKQVAAAKADDNINVLALASDFIDVEKAKRFVDAFLHTPSKTEDKYARRIKELDNLV